jgi:hypothetical protein
MAATEWLSSTEFATWVGADLLGGPRTRVGARANRRRAWAATTCEIAYGELEAATNTDVYRITSRCILQWSIVEPPTNSYLVLHRVCVQRFDECRGRAYRIPAGAEASHHRIVLRRYLYQVRGQYDHQEEIENRPSPKPEHDERETAERKNRRSKMNGS